MPQHKWRRAKADLREFLLDERKSFIRQMCQLLAEDPRWSAQAWEQLSRSVDTLADREPYRLHAWMLPDGHWALVHGADVDWVLGADDVLRVAP